MPFFYAVGIRGRGEVNEGAGNQHHHNSTYPCKPKSPKRQNPESLPAEYGGGVSEAITVIAIPSSADYFSLHRSAGHPPPGFFHLTAAVYFREPLLFQIRYTMLSSPFFSPLCIFFMGSDRILLLITPWNWVIIPPDSGPRGKF